jgi:hypothetical protein
MTGIKTFPSKTRERIRRLSDYMVREVLNETFVCRSFKQCRESCGLGTFYEGQLHHVGRHYDLEIDRKPTRVAIVGQEYGTGPNLVSLDARYQMIRASSAKGFRGRNPHMKGTTTLLRLLLRRHPGVDDANEQLLPDTGIHIFDGFALVNFLLCSVISSPRESPLAVARFRGAAPGLSSRTMRKNCTDHFRQVIAILDPTIIIAQGIGVRRWLGTAYDIPFHRGPIDPSRIGSADLLTFVHPSARSEHCWGNSLESDYLRRTVIPAVSEYLGSATCAQAF